MWEWLLSPIDPARVHSIAGLLSWHARLMVMGWGVMIPLGVVIARYFKVWPGQDWPRQLDSRVWWRSHLILQIGGYCVALIALALVVFEIGGLDESWHGILGWAVMGLATAQILSGWLRGTKGGPTDPAGKLRGDHYDMTPRRRVFEAFHKGVGYALLAAATCAILLGLWQANAPHWMWLAIGGFWSGLLMAALVLQRRKPPIPTYQAIWGPDPDLPGNRSP